MKRTKGKDEKVDKSIYVKYSLVDKFSEYPNFIDVLSLYVFYHKMGIQQGSNQPYATDTYCMKGMRIGRGRFYKAKKVLLKLKLITQIKQGGTKSRFGKPYVRLNDKRKETTPQVLKPKESREMKQKETGQKALTEMYHELIGGEGRVRPVKMKRTKVKKPPQTCPHGHKWAEDFEEYRECFDCEKWDACDEANRQL